MKGRKTRATGGVNEAAQDAGRKNMRYTYQSNVNDEAEKRKSGGKVKGMEAKHHAGRKARKSGGSCDSGNPFSSAHSGTAPKGRKLEMN